MSEIDQAIKYISNILNNCSIQDGEYIYWGEDFKYILDLLLKFKVKSGISCKDIYVPCIKCLLERRTFKEIKISNSKAISCEDSIGRGYWCKKCLKEYAGDV